jgi:hypothetical protein
MVGWQVSFVFSTIGDAIVGHLRGPHAIPSFACSPVLPTSAAAIPFALAFPSRSKGLHIFHHDRTIIIRHASEERYRYFAFGSNLLPETMEWLRGIPVRDDAASGLGSRPAILPEFELAFDVPGVPGIEPSAASARPCSGSSLHGVVYDLSAAEFAAVGQTEGVPFTYVWQACHVYPYSQNHEGNAGEIIYEKWRERRQNSPDRSNQSDDDVLPVLAYTLVSLVRNNEQRPFIPPSSSYLHIIRRGACYWRLDASYQEKLAQLEVANGLLPFCPGGLAGSLLKSAGIRYQRRRPTQQGFL